MSVNQSKNRTLLNTIIYSAGNILPQGLAFISLPIFTRYLTTTEFGIFNYTTTIQAFLIIVGALSMNSFVLRHFFELDTDDDRQKLFGSVFIFTLLASVFLLALELLTFPFLISYFKIKIAFNPYFVLALVTVVLEIAAMIPLAYFRVEQKALPYFLLTSIKAVLVLVVSLILIIHFKMGVLGRYYGILSIGSIFFFIYMFLMYRISKFKFSPAFIMRGLKFSLPILPTAFITIALVSVDRIILEKQASLSQLGVYSIAFVLGTVLNILVRGFYQAIEPEIYKSFRSSDYKKDVEEIKNNFLFLSLALGCSVIVFSNEIVRLMVSKSFYEARFLIPFFVVSSIFLGPQVIADTTIYAANKTVYQFWSSMSALIVNVVLNIIFIPRFGMIAAAVVFMCSSWVYYFCSAHFSRRFTQIYWNRLRDSLMIFVFCAFSYFIMLVHLEIFALNILFKAVSLVLIVGVIGRFFHHDKIRQLCLIPMGK